MAKPPNGDHTASPKASRARGRLLAASAIQADAATLAQANGGHDGDLIIDPKNGPATARQVLGARFTDVVRGAYLIPHGVRTLHFHEGRWLHWNGATCREIEQIEVEIATKEVLERARCKDRDGQPVPVKVSETLLSSTVKFMSLEASINLTLPAWLPPLNAGDDEGLPAAEDVLACGNGLIDLRTGLFYPPHPRFLSVTGSNIPWQADAECPRWQVFLNQIFDRDADQIREAQKWCGYVLSSSSSLQKALLLIGPPRSGKGTFARICRALVGERHYAGPSLASLQERFGLAPLIDKRLVVVDEATLGPKVDRSEVGSVIRKATGQDTFTIDRKHGPAWTGQLAFKLMLIVNELPSFSDASGALATRFLVLQTRHSFVDVEDRTLELRLMQELPGILRWAVEGYGYLLADGGFAAPASTRETFERFRDSMADVAAFVRDVCVFDPTKSEPTVAVYEAFLKWRDDKGMDTKRPPTREWFGRKLRIAAPDVREAKLRINGVRVHHYAGMRLRRDDELSL